ncbi:MAG: DUF1553 domain-containing protein, partial [Verrucomicrobiota bacterium]
ANPRNRYFAQNLVNRVWKDLMGRGFYEPVDDFVSESNVSHPATMGYLANEFVAGGYSLRHLLRVMVQTEAYQRGALDAAASLEARTQSEKAFTAGTTRRMLGEVLYDSIVIAGHVDDYKWPKGANMKTIEKRVRVPLDADGNVDTTPTPASAAGSTMMGGMTAMASAGGSAYDLENSFELDFKKLLAKKEVKDDLAMMKMMSDMELKAQQDAKMMAESQNRRRRYTYIKVEETVDDNPKFSSTMRMASPAPPAHFLRVFGQPSRETLGEFREEDPSMRQSLMMLNGKATHEASRVGPQEPLYALLAGAKANAERAIKFAYLETLTRYPDAEEMVFAKNVLEGAPDLLEGMADLRWALLNCNEF